MSMFGKNNLFPVHLEAQIVGDASAGVAFKIFQMGVDITATFTAGGKSGVAITDVEVITSDGGTVAIVADSVADGKRVAGGSVAPNGGIVKGLITPHYCAAGVVPKMIGPATGTTKAVLHGFLYRA